MTRPPLVLVPQYFGSTVFDRRTSRYMPFDQETTDLLLKSRIKAFDLVIDGNDERARFFAHFYELGYFTHDLRLAANVLDVQVPDDHLVGPLALHLEIVAACNLKCSHCFAGPLPRKEQPLTLVELDTLFATLARMGTFRIGLTGGEPLMRRDVFEIMDLAVSHGLCPCITTNGLYMTDAIARELGKRNLVWVNVSLDGATARTNDVVRGPGTFDRVLEKLEVLRRHSRFTLAFTIMHHNAHEVRECAELAARVGADTAVFRPLYPVGVARHHLEMMPTFEEYSGALRELADLDVDLRSTEPFSPATRAEQQAVVFQNYGCGAGNLVCSISLSGDVNPCSFLGPENAAANLRHVPFEQIWHGSQRFRSIRGLPGDGGTSTFGGGCRARSLVLAGDMNAPDPWLTAHERHGGVHPLVVLQPTARRS